MVNKTGLDRWWDQEDSDDRDHTYHIGENGKSNRIERNIGLSNLYFNSIKIKIKWKQIKETFYIDDVSWHKSWVIKNKYNNDNIAQMHEIKHGIT